MIFPFDPHSFRIQSWTGLDSLAGLVRPAGLLTGDHGFVGFFFFQKQNLNILVSSIQFNDTYDTEVGPHPSIFNVIPKGQLNTRDLYPYVATS